MGGADLNDLLRTAALAKELPSVDAGKLFLLGESRGGMMVFQALREGAGSAGQRDKLITDWFAMHASKSGEGRD